MAVTLDGGSGLFDRLGKIGHLINTINGRRGGASAGDYPVELNDVLVEYDGQVNEIRAVTVRLLQELESCQQGHSSLLAELRRAAQEDLVRSFHLDDPLEELTVAAALDALRRQMLTATTRYVEANTVSASPTSTGNTGDGAILCHVKDGYGRVLENLLAEDLRITVTDASTPANATLRVRGEVAVNDKLDHAWPAGSGADASYTAIDAAGDENLLAGGDFETWTVANTPDDWEITVGAAGTDVLESADQYAGSSALQIVGDGATLTALVQQLSVANLASLTPYGLNAFMKVDVVPAAGVLTIDLFDGSNVINDEAGNPCQLVVDLTALSTSYAPANFGFALPEPLPSNVYLRMRLTTALSSGSSLLVDHAALAALSQPGSVAGQTPYLAFFSGATPWAADDGAGTKVLQVTSANNRASQQQELLDKLFDTAELGWTAPTSGTTIIADNLIA